MTMDKNTQEVLVTVRAHRQNLIDALANPRKGWAVVTPTLLCLRFEEDGSPKVCGTLDAPLFPRRYAELRARGVVDGNGDGARAEEYSTVLRAQLSRAEGVIATLDANR